MTTICIRTKINEFGQKIESGTAFVLQVGSQRCGDLSFSLTPGSWFIEEKVDQRTKKYRVSVKRIK